MTGGGAVAGEHRGAFPSLGARFLAGLIDVVVVTILSLIVSRLLTDAPGRAGDATVTIVVSLYFLASYTAAAGGCSVGKFVLGVRVVDAAGMPLSLRAALVRWLLTIGILLPLLFLAAGFERGTPLRTGQAFAVGVPVLCVLVVDSYMGFASRVGHRSLHDLAAGSFVVRKDHAGAVPQTGSLGRRHWAWMGLLCTLVALWFVRVYPWARAIGERAAPLMKARAAALAAGRASRLIVAPGFALQGVDTAWFVSAIATIHAKPATAREAEALRKSLACALAREAPLAFRSAELQLMLTFDAGPVPGGTTSAYIADLELTPAACQGL